MFICVLLLVTQTLIKTKGCVLDGWGDFRLNRDHCFKVRWSDLQLLNLGAMNLLKIK